VKPVKVSGYVSPGDHEQLKDFAKHRQTTIGVLVATAVRLLLKAPAKSLRGLPMDGRRA
jgi:antitoxin component of RelBE/YafQ-DinJ toxin-antitoxin module